MTQTTAKYFFVSLLCVSIFTLNGMAPKNTPAKATQVSASAHKATPCKIATFDLRRVLPMDNNADLSGSSHEWRDFINDLKDRLTPFDKELQGLEEAFKKGKAEFESLQQSRIASKEALENKAEIIMGLQNQWRLKMSEREQMLSKEVGEEQAVLMPKITTIVEKLSREQGWDGVAHKEIFVVSPKLVDLTDQVLSMLNKNYAAQLKAKEQKAEQDKKTIVAPPAA